MQKAVFFAVDDLIHKKEHRYSCLCVYVCVCILATVLFLGIGRAGFYEILIKRKGIYSTLLITFIVFYSQSQ